MVEYIENIINKYMDTDSLINIESGSNSHIHEISETEVLKTATGYLTTSEYTEFSNWNLPYQQIGSYTREYTDIGSISDVEYARLLSENPAAQLVREAYFLNKLNHPNIVKPKGGLILTDTPGGQRVQLRLERIGTKSTTLYEEMMEAVIQNNTENRRALLNRTFQNLRGVASAIDYIHDQGIIHRDINPGNILRREDGEFVLTDFGLATFDDSKYITDRPVGKPGFIAPEYYSGLDYLSRGSDQFSFAATLAQTIIGFNPTIVESGVKPDIEKITEQANFNLTVFKNGLSGMRFYQEQFDALIDIFKIALNRDPNVRFANNKILLELCIGVLENNPMYIQYVNAVTASRAMVPIVSSNREPIIKKDTTVSKKFLEIIGVEAGDNPGQQLFEIITAYPERVPIPPGLSSDFYLVDRRAA